MRRSPWWAALGWAAVILVATSIPGRDLPHTFSNADKLVHFGMYGVLGALVARARRRGAAWLATLAAVAAFAAFDEWHQNFVPGRDASRYDWLADVAGAAAGIAVVANTIHRSEQRI